MLSIIGHLYEAGALMKINNFSSGILTPNKNNYSQGNSRFQTSKSQSSNDQFELSKMEQILSPNIPSVTDPKTNSLNFKPDEIKNIGNVDGLPLNVSFDSYGMNTSFGITINKNDTIDSPRTQFALDVFNRHTAAQRYKAGSIISRFQSLYLVADGSMSVKQYNEADFGPDTISTSELLTSLGIDVSKSFSFNGKSFSLDSEGNLHALLSASQYNVTQ